MILTVALSCFAAGLAFGGFLDAVAWREFRRAVYFAASTAAFLFIAAVA